MVTVLADMRFSLWTELPWDDFAGRSCQPHTQIRTVELTASDNGDSPALPHPLDQLPPDKPIGTVTRDGAFDTRRCHIAILKYGGTAITSMRENGCRWHEDCPVAIA